MPEDYYTLVIGGCSFSVVSLSSLKELYKRGLEATADQIIKDDQAKHATIAKKYEALRAL